MLVTTAVLAVYAHMARTRKKRRLRMLFLSVLFCVVMNNKVVLQDGTGSLGSPMGRARKRQKYGDNGATAQGDQFVSYYFGPNRHPTVTLKRFMKLFRVPHELVEKLVLDLTPLLLPQVNRLRPDTVFPTERILLGLLFLGSTDVTTLDKLTGRGLSTIRASCVKFCHAVVQTYLHETISIPNTAEEIKEITDWFLYNRSMPMCVGAIDGKHFAVNGGADDFDSLTNYKVSHHTKHTRTPFTLWANQ